MNKVNFTVEKDGKTLELAVVRPSIKAQQEAQMVYAKAFADYVKAGAILQAKLEAYIREQKLWDDARQAEWERLDTRLSENEKLVRGQVKGTTFAQARAAAIQMRFDRAAIRSLTADRVALRNNTVEGQAENQRFNYLVSVCTVHADSKKPYFRDLDDYLTRDEDPATLAAANAFASLYYNYDPAAEKSQPENQFLLKYRLCNDELHLVKVIDGVERLVDAEGRLVNAEGRFVNEAGELVDVDGNRVDESGQPVVVETFPFLDESGNPME